MAPGVLFGAVALSISIVASGPTKRSSNVHVPG